MIYLTLIQNIALLISLSLVRAQMTKSFNYMTGRTGVALFYKVLDGLLFGGIGLVAMMTPLRFASGVIFDSRSVILAAAGLFGGPVTAGLAATICGAYRLWLGGAGAVMGLAVIGEASVLGIVWHYLSRRRPELMGNVPLLGFGFLVHLIMVGLMLFLPAGVRWEVAQKITLPVLLLYPPATMLVCWLFKNLQESAEHEARLAESEARYRNLFNNQHTVMWIIDPNDGTIVDANPAAEKYYGWSREQLTQMRVSQINIMSEDEIRAEMQKALEQKRNYFNFQHRRADGSVSPVEVYWGPIKLKGRHLLYSIIHDISEKYEAQKRLEELNRSLTESQRLAEESLKASEKSRLALLNILEDEKLARAQAIVARERYQRLIQGMVDGFVVVGMNRKILEFNEAYRAMLGYSREELLEATYQQLTPEKWHKIEADIVENEIIPKGYSGIYEKEYRRKDGTVFPVELRTYLLKGQNGEQDVMWAFVRDVTARRQTERAIKENERRLRRAQKIGRLGGWEWDIKNNIVVWSDELYEIWGLPHGIKITWETIKSRIHSEDAAKFKAQMDLSMTGFDAVDYEFRIIHPDGTVRTIYQNIEVVRNEKNEAVIAHGVMQDITARKREEQVKQALYQVSEIASGCRDQQELFKQIHKTVSQLMAANNFYIALYDKDRQTIEFPYYCDEQNKYPASRKFGKGLTEYIITTQKPLLVNHQVYEQLKREGSAEFIGVPSKQWMGVPLISEGHAFGTLVVQSYDNSTTYTDSDLDLLNYVGSHVATAILGIKKSKELLESQVRYRTFIDSTDDMAFLKDSQGKYLIVNRAFELFLGRNQSEIINHTNQELMAENLCAACQQLEMQVSESKKTLVSKLLYNNRNYEIKVFPVMLGDGSTGIGGYIADITDVIRIQEQNKLVNMELEQIRKMEAIGHLAGGVAHDFNNMLTGILGNAELLKIKLSNNEAVKGMIDNIINSAGHAANLTKQLLAFARKGQFQLVPVNVHKIIGETCDLLGSTIDRRISIEQNLKANPPMVMADPTQLENCLMNLGINARDAMPQGGRMVFSTEVVELDETYISLHRYQIQPGRYIQITVSDNGMGMDDDVKRHLFEPFFTTKGPGKGTGLGLAGVYGCVKNHSGSIEIYSEVGHGTAVKIYLPLLQTGPEKLTEEYREPLAKESGTLMIVDDEDVIRYIAAQLLEDAGYRVICCRDGNEAIDTYIKGQESIDLVILDMIMPGKNGQETFHELKNINPEIRVLLSSGFSEDGEAQEIINSGAKGFIQKPYRRNELLIKIKQALGKSS